MDWLSRSVLDGLAVLSARWRRVCWLWGSDPGWIELWSGFVAFYWGAVLLLPARTFGHDYYATMEAAMPEDAWGSLLLAIGLAQVAAVHFRRPALAWVASSISAGIWAVIGFSIWLQAPFTAGVGIHAGLAVAASYATAYRVRHGYE